MLLRKPLSGAVIGALIGVCVAVVLARQGIWPADQLTLFLLPALTGGLGALALSWGREGSNVTLVIALSILIPMTVWGALGFGEVDQTGQLNGSCTVEAASESDTTTIIDTTRGDPFEIDPDGGLAWQATSPEVFSDYRWELGVVLGGIPVPIDSDTEANEDGATENGGVVPDIGAYVSERGIDLDLYVGVYEVAGSAATCDGFGFVEILGGGFDPVTIIALASLVILLVILGILIYPGRRPGGGDGNGDPEASIDMSEKLRGYEAGATDFPTRQDLD